MRDAIDDEEVSDLARCIRCGCTDEEPCAGGCWWVPMEVSGELADVCSSCIEDEDLLAARLEESA